MFKCVYKADMTEQQITMQNKARPGGYPVDRYTYRQRQQRHIYIHIIGKFTCKYCEAQKPQTYTSNNTISFNNPILDPE